MDIIIDDFEHSVTDKIAQNKDNPLFPQIEKYGITNDELSDYLFEKQAILDADADLRKKYTIYGFLLIVPVIVAQSFVNGALPLLASLAVGACLCGVYWIASKLFRRWKLKRISTPQLVKYVDDVLAYQESQAK